MNTTENYWNGLLIEYLYDNNIKDKPRFLPLKKWHMVWGNSVPFQKFRVLPIGKIMRLPMLKPNSFFGTELIHLNSERVRE